MSQEVPHGLTAVSQRELRALLRGIEAGWLTLPCNELALRHVGISEAHCGSIGQTLQGIDVPAARVLLQAVLAERVHRPPPRLELVWTGAQAAGSLARDTGVVVRRLFERATSSVIIGGFRFDQGETLFRPLHDRMQNGLQVSLFVDIEGHAATPAGGRAFAENAIDQLFADNWPFGSPYPKVYYDPRSAIPGPPWVSMHAKCIVVDDCYAFITSANFTERGQTRNLEAGVCIEDRDFAEQLAAQWRTLVTQGLVESYMR